MSMSGTVPVAGDLRNAEGEVRQEAARRGRRAAAGIPPWLGRHSFVLMILMRTSETPPKKVAAREIFNPSEDWFSA